MKRAHITIVVSALAILSPRFAAAQAVAEETIEAPPEPKPRKKSKAASEDVMDGDQQQKIIDTDLPWFRPAVGSAFRLPPPPPPLTEDQMRRYREGIGMIGMAYERNFMQSPLYGNKDVTLDNFLVHFNYGNNLGLDVGIAKFGDELSVALTEMDDFTGDVTVLPPAKAQSGLVLGLLPWEYGIPINLRVPKHSLYIMLPRPILRATLMRDINMLTVGLIPVGVRYGYCIGKRWSFIAEIAGPVYTFNIASIGANGNPVFDQSTSQSLGFRLNAGFGF